MFECCFDRSETNFVPRNLIFTKKSLLKSLRPRIPIKVLKLCDKVKMDLARARQWHINDVSEALEQRCEHHFLLGFHELPLLLKFHWFP